MTPARRRNTCRPRYRIPSCSTGRTAWGERLGFFGGEDLKKEFEKNSITPDKEVVCYCHSGMRASYKYMQLKIAGYDNVKLYDGSIIDWAMRRNPIR